MIIKRFYQCLHIAFCLLLLVTPVRADDLLPDRMAGSWTGNLDIWSGGVKRDSVPVTLTIASRGRDRWQWKMEYHSKTNPMVKDYELRVKDRTKGHFITDEGGGVILEDFVIGDKMVSQFETQGIWLTSTQELRDGKLMFEVTAGKRSDIPSTGVTNITITSVQRAMLKRAKGNVRLGQVSKQ